MDICSNIPRYSLLHLLLKLFPDFINNAGLKFRIWKLSRNEIERLLFCSNTEVFKAVVKMSSFKFHFRKNLNTRGFCLLCWKKESQHFHSCARKREWFHFSGVYGLLSSEVYVVLLEHVIAYLLVPRIRVVVGEVVCSFQIIFFSTVILDVSFYFPPLWRLVIILRNLLLLF